MQTIIWDWNGTLLNDLDFCVATINKLLNNRNLSLLNKDLYREAFSFPVKNYYKTIGFDFEKEDFAIPAKEFIDLYDDGVGNCSLHKSAIDVLSYFKKSGVQQFVLSAMQQNMLEQTLKHNSISNFFEGIYGLDNHYAASKIERGEQLITKFNVDKKETLIIGDTIHDFEVAEKLGIKCILIPNGHQSKERLEETKATIITNLEHLLNVNVKEYF